MVGREEICKRVEVYSVTPVSLQSQPTIILFLSIAAKKAARKEGREERSLESAGLLFFRAHFKICFFFLPFSFLSSKLSFVWKIAP